MVEHLFVDQKVKGSTPFSRPRALSSMVEQWTFNPEVMGSSPIVLNSPHRLMVRTLVFRVKNAGSNPAGDRLFRNVA